MLRRPAIDLPGLLEAAALDDPGLDAEDALQVLIQCRYEGYIRREREAIARLQQLSALEFPVDFLFVGIPGLRTELVEKLGEARPGTLGDAARIPGMTPAALSRLAGRLSTRARRGETGEVAVSSSRPR